MQRRGEQITQLLQAWNQCDQCTLEKLVPLVYDELHRLAQRYMADERPEHSMQTTELVSEAYVRLVDSSHGGGRGSAQSRISFASASVRHCDMRENQRRLLQEAVAARTTEILFFRAAGEVFGTGLTGGARNREMEEPRADIDEGVAGHFRIFDPGVGSTNLIQPVGLLGFRPALQHHRTAFWPAEREPVSSWCDPDPVPGKGGRFRMARNIGATPESRSLKCQYGQDGPPRNTQVVRGAGVNM